MYVPIVGDYCPFKLNSSLTFISFSPYIPKPRNLKTLSKSQSFF